MAIANAYNPNPVTTDSLLRERQTQFDMMKQEGLVEAPEPYVQPKNQKFLGVEQTGDYEGKSFLRKLGEDAALLAYAIPVGLAQVVTHPVKFVKSAVMNEEGDVTRGALGQSVRDAVDPDYYKAHPLLGIVNLAGFIAPIAGAAKAAALKTATKTALNVAVKEATLSGIDDVVVRSALSSKIMKAAVTEASKTGKTTIAQEVIRSALSKAGVADELALKVGASVADNLYTTFSRQTTKMKVLESIAHPFGTTYKYASGKIDPLRKAVFGDTAKTAVGTLYGADIVSKNPEGFLNIERWAEAQLSERGINNTAQNRLRIMQDWVDQNSQWGALDAEGRISHFKNYAEQDLIRLKIHEATGMDIVTTKALPQHYVDAMVETIKNASDGDDLLKILDDNFGNDYGIHSAEIIKATEKGLTKESLIDVVSKLGQSRSQVSFTKFSPDVQSLALELEKTGYRIGLAPKNKPVSFAADIFAGAGSGVKQADDFQVGITSAQPASQNAIVVEKLAQGDKLFQAGQVDEAIKTLQGVTQTTKRELSDILTDGITDVRRIETDTHGLYFGTPEPSYWLTIKTSQINTTLASIAEFAKKNAQESFITAKRLIGDVGEKGSFGLSIRFGKALGNDDILKIEKLVNENGIGLTLNQKTGEAIAYNIQQWDNLSPVQFVETASKVKDSLKSAGYNFKASVDKYELGVYTKDTYDNIITKGQIAKRGADGAEVQPGGLAGREGEITTGQRASSVSREDTLATRTALGNWLDRFGFSTKGLVEGAAEYSYRENFTQRVISDIAPKYGSVVKAGKISIPVEKLFEWIEKNRTLFQQARGRSSLPIRTVFDVRADDLVRAGFTSEIAGMVEGISRKALREIPTSITGMGDAVINYMRTSNKGFGKWMSDWYDTYLKVAYKGRYDWSPFFAAQQWLETRINSALLLKDVRALPGGAAVTKLGTWTAEKFGKSLDDAKTYLKQVVDEPPLEEVSMVRDDILGTLQKTMLDYTSTPDIVGIMNSAKGGLSSLKDKAVFEQSIRSRNVWYSIFNQSNVRMATTFNKAMANKFGMTVSEALDFTLENGVKKFKNPQLVQLMREATQSAYHYDPGILTSPLMKTLNIVWFPMRFQVKTMQLAAKWMNSLSPTNRMVVMNNWVHFANWAGTDEGIKWRRTNRNILYNILAYTTAYEQIGQAAEAVTKGRLFGGNAGLIGGVPFGFLVNLARELAILPEDTDQFDPKTGKRFTKETPRKFISAASLSAAIEQLLISISPSTPFYSLTGGVIGGVSPRKIIESLTRQVVGASKEALEGRDPARGRQQLERDFKRVPLDYTRMAE